MMFTFTDTCWLNLSANFSKKNNPTKFKNRHFKACTRNVGGPERVNLEPVPLHGLRVWSRLTHWPRQTRLQVGGGSAAVCVCVEPQTGESPPTCHHLLQSVWRKSQYTALTTKNRVWKRWLSVMWWISSWSGWNQGQEVRSRVCDLVWER